jgi:predicted transcriptional regulator
VTRTCIWLDDAARKRLRLAAAALDVTQGEIIRQAVNARLNVIESTHPEVQRVLAAA